MRPTTLDEVVGQEHIIGPESCCTVRSRRINSAPSFLRPSGNGKNDACPRHRQHDKRRVYPAECHDSRQKGYGRSRKKAQQRDRHVRQKTILLSTRIHRFNKGQQDYLLPFVEDGTTRSDWRDDGKPVFRGQRGADFSFHYL